MFLYPLFNMTTPWLVYFPLLHHESKQWTQPFRKKNNVSSNFTTKSVTSNWPDLSEHFTFFFPISYRNFHILSLHLASLNIATSVQDQFSAKTTKRTNQKAALDWPIRKLSPTVQLMACPPWKSDAASEIGTTEDERACTLYSFQIWRSQGLARWTGQQLDSWT